MNIIGHIAAFVVMVAAFSIMVGARDFGVRLLKGVVVGIVLITMGPGLARALFHELLAAGGGAGTATGSLDEATSGLKTSALYGLVVFAIVVVLLAWVRFKNRQRQLTRWIGERPTSAKRRIDLE